MSHHNSKENDMKQRELFNSGIVKDREKIRFYLAQCLRILKGEEL